MGWGLWLTFPAPTGEFWQTLKRMLAPGWGSFIKLENWNNSLKTVSWAWTLLQCCLLENQPSEPVTTIRSISRFSIPTVENFVQGCELLTKNWAHFGSPPSPFRTNIDMCNNYYSIKWPFKLWQKLNHFWHWSQFAGKKLLSLSSFIGTSILAKITTFENVNLILQHCSKHD